ncbi:MAG: DUF2520 domain-containing protein [Bacteroidota bacterium]|nr:DUF2520 domain-containing protein [Bacteroidota bacterium]
MSMGESRIITIALVGAGSVATHLGLALKNAGYKVEYVLNRGAERGTVLAEKLEARYVTGFDQLVKPDLMIIAVSDDAIPVMARQLGLCTFPVVHTSGTIAKEVLSVTGPDYGVFYPLQSFSPDKEVDFLKVPICIDASNTALIQRLEDVARSLSQTVCLIDDSKRKILHLAAVFACNFSNYLYGIAHDLLAENDIPFELLLPLIQETAMKVQVRSAFDAQTGPAKRGDVSTIRQHLDMIQNDPKLLKIYKTFTDNILKTYSHQFSTSDIHPEEE